MYSICISTPIFQFISPHLTSQPLFSVCFCFVDKFISTVFSASLVAQTVKHLPTIWETQLRSLGGEDPLEKEMATHSSILAWKIPWMEEHSRLQSMGSQRVGHNRGLHFNSVLKLKNNRIGRLTGFVFSFCVKCTP